MRKLPTKSVRMWIGRDEDNSLWLFSSKPKKLEKHNMWSINGQIMMLDPNLFPNVKWEDNKPTRVYLRTVT